MKIIISPAKIQKNVLELPNSMDELLFEKKTEKLKNKLSSMTKGELAVIIKAKGNILDDSYNKYQNFDKNRKIHGISMYKGLVYQQIDYLNYNEDQINYMNDHLLILSTLYGIVRPLTGIKPYRLDYNAKIEGIKNYWTKEINETLKNEKVLNLASKEFSRNIDNIINVEFFSLVDGKLITKATFSKMARGLMVDWIIKNNISSIDDIVSFDMMEYRYKKIENSNSYVFVREE